MFNETRKAVPSLKHNTVSLSEAEAQDVHNQCLTRRKSHSKDSLQNES